MNTDIYEDDQLDGNGDEDERDKRFYCKGCGKELGSGEDNREYCDGYCCDCYKSEVDDI